MQLATHNVALNTMIDYETVMSSFVTTLTMCCRFIDRFVNMSEEACTWYPSVTTMAQLMRQTPIATETLKLYCLVCVFFPIATLLLSSESDGAGPLCVSDIFEMFTNSGMELWDNRENYNHAIGYLKDFGWINIDNTTSTVTLTNFSRCNLFSAAQMLDMMRFFMLFRRDYFLNRWNRLVFKRFAQVACITGTRTRSGNRKCLTFVCESATSAANMMPSYFNVEKITRKIGPNAYMAYRNCRH